MYTIRIKDLTATTTLGVYDWEKDAPRQVLLNIELQVEEDGASKSDDLANAVDYATLESRIVTHLAARSYQLLEKLVTDIAELLLTEDSRILRVKVEADKHGALQHARSVSVETERTRS